MPDDVLTSAEAGDSLLEVAARAGVQISTGCLMGSCHACEVEITNIGDSDVEGDAAGNSSAVDGNPQDIVLACLTAVPKETTHLEINLTTDPTW